MVRRGGLQRRLWTCQKRILAWNDEGAERVKRLDPHAVNGGEKWGGGTTHDAARWTAAGQRVRERNCREHDQVELSFECAPVTHMKSLYEIVRFYYGARPPLVGVRLATTLRPEATSH